MVRTVTVRLSVAAGFVLLVCSGGLYGYGMCDAATRDCSDGVLVERTESPASEQVMDFTALSRAQQGAFPLALDDLEDGHGSFFTTDEETSAVLDEVPDRVQYEGTTYHLTPVEAGCFGGGLTIPASFLVALAGLFVLLGAGVASVVRRVRD